MARVTKSVGKNQFFELQRDFWLMLGAGLLFSVCLTFLPAILDALLCHLVEPICLSSGAKNYQIALILSGLLATIFLLGYKVDRLLFVIAPSLAVFWFWSARQTDWLAQLLVYLGLSLVIFGLFAWVAQVRDWRLALGINVVLTVIIILCVR